MSSTNSACHLHTSINNIAYRPIPNFFGPTSEIKKFGTLITHRHDFNSLGHWVNKYKKYKKTSNF